MGVPCPWGKSLDERWKNNKSDPIPLLLNPKKKKEIWHLGFSGFFSELLEKGRQDTGPYSPRRIALLGRSSGVRWHFLSPLPPPGPQSPGTCHLSSSSGHSPGTMATAPQAGTSVLGLTGLAIVPLQHRPPHPPSQVLLQKAELAQGLPAGLLRRPAARELDGDALGPEPNSPGQ